MNNKVKTKTLGIIKRIVNRELGGYYGMDWIHAKVNNCKNFKEIVNVIEDAGFHVENKLRRRYQIGKN